MNATEFPVRSGGAGFKCTLAIPGEGLAGEHSALLLNISATADLALGDETQNHPVQPFLDAGHFVASFDLPCHGERVRPGQGEALSGMGRAFLAGEDPFAQFVRDGKAAVDACLERGAGNGRVVGYGVSRAGYCLLRLAAADPRLLAVAALSPVTDWGIPEEFTETCPRTRTWPLRISHWAGDLAATAVHLSVGSQDDVVGTRACVDFAMELFEIQRRERRQETLLSQLHVVDSPGHSPSRESRLDAVRFLLEYCVKGDQAPQRRETVP